jgi:hypothetical protein
MGGARAIAGVGETMKRKNPRSFQTKWLKRPTP